MSDLSRMLRLGLLGVAAMTVVVPGILLAHVTTGHDWYAARKLTVAEAMLVVGFSKYETVAYRTEYGDTWNISRFAFVEYRPPIRARQRILSMIGDGVMLGAGIGGTVFCLMLLGAAGHLRRSRAVSTVEPAPSAYPYRHPAPWGAAGRISGWFRPGGGRGRVALLAVPVEEIGNAAIVLHDAHLSGPWTPAGPGASAAEAPAALPAANARTGAAPDEAGAGSVPPEPVAKPGTGRANKPREQIPGPPGKSASMEGDGNSSRDRRSPSRSKPDDDGDWI